MTANTPLIGIDFGTTKTLVAEYSPRTGHARPFRLGRGRDEMSTSMYMTKEGEWLYGEDADDEGETDKLNLFHRFKMRLGNEGVAQPGRGAAPAEDLTERFLRKIREQLEKKRASQGAVSQAVVTVPAMFGPLQRKRLKQASIKAGISDIALLEEPVAAGIAYCHSQTVAEPMCFLVADWGGGTFDTALVKSDENGQVTIVDEFVDGLDSIGGETFTDDLWQVLESNLKKLNGLSMSSQPSTMWGRYRRDINRAKERLSEMDRVPIKMMLGSKSVQVDFERDNLEEAMADKIHKAGNFLQILLEKVKSAGHEVEFILLAGGTSRMPMIKRVFEKLLNKECRVWAEGREAIALGAAIHANELWGYTQNHSGKITNSMLPTYKGLVEAAWIDKEITDDEFKFLVGKRGRLGVSESEAEDAERLIIGKTANEATNDMARSVSGGAHPQESSSDDSQVAKAKALIKQSAANNGEEARALLEASAMMGSTESHSHGDDLNLASNPGSVKASAPAKPKRGVIILTIMLLFATAIGIAYHYGKLDDAIAYFKSEEQKPTTSPELNGKVVKESNTQKREGLLYEINHDQAYTGLVLDYYDNGKRKQEYGVVEGLKSGKTTFWTKDGIKLAEDYFKEGKKHGLSKIWDKKGNILLQAEFNAGKLNGKTVSYYDGIQIKEVEHYKHGLKHGNFIQYTKYGVKTSEANFKNDKLHGVLKMWNNKGFLQADENYVNGLKQGLARKFYESGQPKSEAQYEKGILNGLAKTFDKLGKLQEEIFYIDGNPCSPWTHSPDHEPKPINY